MRHSGLYQWESDPAKPQPTDLVVLRLSAPGKPTVYTRAMFDRAAGANRLFAYTFSVSVSGRYQLSLSTNGVNFWPPTLDDLLLTNENATVAGYPGGEALLESFL